jgi:iron complex outermembrane receptor protein
VTRPLPHRQTLVAGLEFRDYLQQDQGAAYEDNRVPAFATKVGTHVVALYAQDEWRTRDWLLLSVGSRFDTYGSVSHFSPRASVVWMPKPTRSVKYLFGSAFRAPNAYELDYLTNGVRNQTLGVETIQSHEVVWEEYLRGRLRTSVSAYWNAADHLITLVGDDPDALSYVNDGRLRARGIEGEVEIRLRSGVEALGSYAYGRASDASGMNLTNAPRHLAKLRVSGNGPVRGSTLAFELQAMSDRLTIMQERAPGFAVANLTYRQPLAGGAGLSFSIRNLFDAAYADPASEEHLEDVIPQDGRTFRFGLEWGWTPR